jgi:arabinofuranosyltransferase
MISMRYAWNFSHGQGLVWNPGEYIQGYTNLLMTLLMAFVSFFLDKTATLLFIQILGIIFMLIIATLAMKIAEHITQAENSRHRPLIKVLSFVCALAYYPFSYWSLMGMETGLLAVLLLSSVLYAIKYVESARSLHLFLHGVYLGLAYLTRNDSIIFAVLIWTYIFWENNKSGRNNKSNWQLLGAIGLYAVFVFGQAAFQYLYYGDLLPNTYTLKLTGMPLFTRVQNGVGFIKPFLLEIVFIIPICVFDQIFNFRRQNLLLFSLIISTIGYQVYVGGDSWNYWRIMSPVMPLAFILYIFAILAVIDSISNTSAFRSYFFRNPFFPPKYVTEVLVVILTMIGLLSANSRFFPEYTFLEKPYQVTNNKNNVNIAIALTQLTTSDATVGVYWAGAIPYFADRVAIDFLGKSDKYIASLPADLSGKMTRYGMTSVPGHNKYDLNYSIKTLQPTFVQGFQWGTQDLSNWAKSKYTTIVYKGVRLSLITDSPKVFWNKITAP